VKILPHPLTLQFLKRCVAFWLGLSLLMLPWFVAPLFMGPVSDQDFWLVLEDKRRMLKSTEGTRRILLAGGSNVLFGVDSGLIEQATGRTVVNVAVVGPLGARFILWYAERYAQAGDTIVLSLEYLPLEPDGSLADAACSYHEVYAFVGGVLNPLEKARFFLASGQKAAERLFHFVIGRTVRNKIYVRSCLNSHGDLVSHLQDSVKVPLRTSRLGGPPPGPMGQEFVDELNAFISRQKARGIDVVFSYPTMCQSYFEDYLPQFLKAQRILEDPVTGLQCPRLDQPTTFVYPDALYFDSVYHLHRQGRMQRSFTLGQEIQRAIGAPKGASLQGGQNLLRAAETLLRVSGQ
jgi:hypothetical protein